MMQPLFVFSDWSFLILRVVLGMIFIAHGWPKISNLKGFRLGVFWATLIAVLEFIGGIFLIIGLLVQPLGILFAIEMVVATLMVKRKMGLVNGYEFDLVVMAGALVFATVGGGLLTLDDFFGLRLY